MRGYGVGVGSVGIAESGNLSRELTVEAESGETAIATALARGRCEVEVELRLRLNGAGFLLEIPAGESVGEHSGRVRIRGGIT